MVPMKSISLRSKPNKTYLKSYRSVSCYRTNERVPTHTAKRDRRNNDRFVGVNNR